MIKRMLLVAFLLAFAASARPDDATGVVCRVIDGDTFEVQNFGLVTLSGVNSPEIGTMDGVHARAYTLENLMGVEVLLKFDPESNRDALGAIPCVVFLEESKGKTIVDKNFNEMIVKAGFAKVR